MFYEAINLNLNIAGAVKNPSKISTKKIKQVLLLIILCVYVRTYIYIYIYIYYKKSIMTTTRKTKIKNTQK